MKRKHKMLFCSNYDVAGIENYLSDQSARGYHFKAWGRLFCTFERGEPRRSVYRLELQKEKNTEPDGEKRELYGQFGWQYICLFGPYFQVWSSNNSDPVELHTDPILESELYEKLYRRDRWIIPVYVVLVAVLLYCIWLNWNIGAPYRLLYRVREGSDFPMLLLVLAEIGILWQSGQDYIYGRRLVQTLKEGRSRPHRRKLSWVSRWYGPIYLLMLLLVIGNTGLSLWRIARWETVNLTDYTGANPAVTLAEVEGDPKLEREVGWIAPDGVDYGNYFYRKSSDLAPVQVEIKEQGIIPGERWRDGSGEYSPSVQIEYYELRFAFLAEPFLEERMEDALDFYRFETVSSTELLDTEFDQAYLVYSGEENQYLFARMGRRVLMVDYHGYGDLSRHVQSIAQRCSSFC